MSSVSPPPRVDPAVQVEGWKYLGQLQLPAWGMISKDQRRLSQEGRSLAGCLWLQEVPQGQSRKEWMSLGNGRALTPKDVRWPIGCCGGSGSPNVGAKVGFGVFLRAFNFCQRLGRGRSQTDLQARQSLGQPGAALERDCPSQRPVLSQRVRAFLPRPRSVTAC